MRKLMLLAVLLTACAPREEANPDSMAAAVPPAPAALTPAMISGTWSGVVMDAMSDSVTSRFTTMSTSDSGGQLTFEGAGAPTISYTTTFNADSMVAHSEPYTAPDNPTGPKVVFHSVGRLVGDKLVGTSMQMLADKQDSVVSRSRWEATRKM